jgi:hypothetical protein
VAAKIPWAGQVAPAFFRFTGVVDLVGGLGIIVPALTRIAPWLTRWAAAGIVALQVCAIVFHVSRGEGNTPFNVLLVGLALFVWWGWGATRPSAGSRYPR